MSSVKDLVNFAVNGDALNLKNTFNELMAAKIAERIDTFRPEVASGMFSPDEGLPSIQEEEYVDEALKGGQKNIDLAPPYGKLTAADFASLRAGNKNKKKVDQTDEGYLHIGAPGEASPYDSFGDVKKNTTRYGYDRRKFSNKRDETSTYKSPKVINSRLTTKEEVEQIDELDRQQGSILNRYISRTTDNPKRKEGRNLALKKKWGDKNYGLPEPNVKAVQREEVEHIDERKLTSAEMRKREEIAKKMPEEDFKKRYGKDWMKVKMATATKIAKEEKETSDLIARASAMMTSSVKDMVSEARRAGRPSKNAEEEDIEPIKTQLEKAVTLRGNKKVTFENGDEIMVPAEHAKKALAMNDSMRTSIQKGDHQKRLGASHASFKKTIGVE